MTSRVESRRRRVSGIVRPGSRRNRASNLRIRATIRPDTQGKLPFFCECGMDHCRDSVWLTLTEANKLMDEGGLLIGAHFVQELRARLESRRT